MKTFQSLVDGLAGKVAVPTNLPGSYERLNWLAGRNRGVEVVSSHIRHHPEKPLPYLTTKPQHVSDHWLNGYNSAIKFVEQATLNMLQSIE